MTFADNINRICAERGTNLTAVVKQVKGSSSFATAINKGSLPKESEIVQMAHILNCSVMDFFSDNEDEEPATDDEKDLLKIYKRASRQQKHRLMAYAYSIGDMENPSEVQVKK